jgi:serine/threonine protein kinase
MSKVFTITEGLENLGALRTGGQGSVYKGKRMGAIYSAIKLIPTPIYSEDENDKNYRNFINEVTKLQKVNENPSPNVVKILSWGITDSGSFPYIEMEFIEGPELCGLLEPPHPKAFTIKELVRVADQLANAIAHCHQVGVKHGDIKSNNVKYNIHSGNYVLLDFGLAIMSEEQRRTSIRHAGAIEFMAPEQHEGKMLLQTDIYSYGIILYELLTGQVPFPLSGDGDTGRNSVMLGHLEGKIPDPMELRKQNLISSLSKVEVLKEMKVPNWLLAVLDRCLKKDPNERYANGMELMDAITEGMLLATLEDSDAKQSILTGTSYAVVPEVTLNDQEKSAIQNEKQVGSAYIQISRRYFYVGLAIIFVIITFLSYAALRKKDQNSSPNVNIKPYEVPYVTYHNEYRRQLQRAEQARLMAAQRKAINDLFSAEQAKFQLEEKKKKRKKFLGIF